MTTELFAVVGAVTAVAALVASQRLTTLVARDMGLKPVRFPLWWYVVSGVVGAVSFARNENERAVSTALIVIVTLLLIVQAPLDLVTRRLSRPVTLIASAAVLSTLAVGARDETSSVIVALCLAVAVTAVYAILHTWSPSSLGWGDVLLIAPLALAIGNFSLDGVALWQLLASLTGAIHILVARRLRGAHGIPFGPHLLAAAWLVLLASV